MACSEVKQNEISRGERRYDPLRYPWIPGTRRFTSRRLGMSYIEPRLNGVTCCDVVPESSPAGVPSANCGVVSVALQVCCEHWYSYAMILPSPSTPARTSPR